MNLAAPFQPTNDTTGTLVVLGKSKLSSSDQQSITKLENQIAKDNHVVSVSDQGLSQDGKVNKAQLVISVQTSSTEASPTVAAIRSTMSSFALPSGLSAYLTGQLPSAVDNQNSQAHAQKLTEDLSVLVILVMLIVVFRAVLAPLVTLVPAIWVLLMSGAIIAEASKAGLQVSTITETMLTVLLLGAGTDYGLFFIMRVREEIADGASAHQAIERAGRYVGESITFSAGTVIVALLTLLLASFGLYSGLGPALALGRRADAAGGAHLAARAAGGVRPGGVLAPPGPAAQQGGRVRPAGRPRHRAPGGHAGAAAWCSWACWACSRPRTPPAVSAADHRPGREPARPRAPT